MRKEVSFFNDTSVAYDREYARETPEGYSFRVRRERVFELLPLQGAGTRILDIAAGPGVMVPGLVERGYTVECVDAAPEMVERAREHYGSLKNVTFAVGDVYELSYADATMGVVTAMGLVEYLEDQDKAMHEIARVTKQNGQVIVTFPNRRSFWRTWARTLRTLTEAPRALYRTLTGRQKYPITHREYTEAEARAYLERHGLIADTAVYYNYKIVPFPFDQWFPRFTVWQSSILEQRCPRLRAMLATAFIVRGTKRT